MIRQYFCGLNVPDDIIHQTMGLKTYHQIKTRHIQDQDQWRKDETAIRRWDCNMTTKKLALSMLKPNTIDWIEQCFTSLPTQYRLYGRRFLIITNTGKGKPNKALKSHF